MTNVDRPQYRQERVSVLSDLRLVFVVNRLDYFISHRLHIAEAVVDLGANVAVLFGEKQGATVPSGSDIIWESIPLSTTNRSLFGEINSILAIRRFFKTFRPNIAHHVTLKPILHGTLASIGLKVKVVNAFAGLGHLFIDDRMKTRVMRQAFLVSLRVGYYMTRPVSLVQNRSDEKILKKLLGDPVCMIKGSGVNCSLYRSQNTPTGEQKFRVAYIGRMIRDKGVDDLIEAGRILQREGYSDRVDIVLAGECDRNNPSSLSAYEIQRLCVRSVGRWVGYVNNIPDLLEGSDVVCLPSHREGLPKALLEGGAAGCALLATNVAGCAEIVKDEVTGLLVPVGSPRDLARTIVWLMDNPERCAELGANAREYVCEHFSEERVQSDHLSLYKSLVQAVNEKPKWGNVSRSIQGE